MLKISKEKKSRNLIKKWTIFIKLYPHDINIICFEQIIEIKLKTALKFTFLFHISYENK